MNLTLLSIFSAAILLFVIYLVNCYSYWRKRRIPCPKGIIPLLGHLLPVLTMQQGMTSFCDKMYKDFPNASMIGFYRLMTPILLIREPELVKIVLQDNFASFNENAMKVNPSADPLLSKHVIFQSGEDWSAGRRRMHNALTGSRFQIMCQDIKEVCKKFADFLERKLKTGDKYKVELKYLFSKFSGEVTANVGLRINGLCFEDEDQTWSFQQISKMIFEASPWETAARTLAPLAPGLNNIIRKSIIPKKVDRFFRTVAREALEIRKGETVPRDDFFQSMCEHAKTECEKIDEDLLASFALGFLMDLGDTSSTTLSFIGYHVAIYPDIQRKLREEILSVLSKHGDVLTYESLQEMTYMDQVIRESQRCYSAVGLLYKSCTKELELKGSDGLRLRVKAGTTVCIPIHSLQRDPKYWVDPETFDPERFSDNRKDNIEKFAYLPFSQGPRICIGIRMSMLLMKACLATFLRNHSFELCPKTKLPITLSPFHFLATPVGGFWVYVKKIK